MPRGIPKAGYRNSGKNKAPDALHAIEVACKRLSARALEVLEKAMMDPNVEVRYQIMAAKEVLDRGWGKPKQSTETTVNVSTTDDFINALRDARARANEMALATAGVPLNADLEVKH